MPILLPIDALVTPMSMTFNTRVNGLSISCRIIIKFIFVRDPIHFAKSWPREIIVIFDMNDGEKIPACIAHKLIFLRLSDLIFLCSSYKNYFQS